MGSDIDLAVLATKKHKCKIIPIHLRLVTSFSSIDSYLKLTPFLGVVAALAKDVRKTSSLGPSLKLPVVFCSYRRDNYLEICVRGRR